MDYSRLTSQLAAIFVLGANACAPQAAAPIGAPQEQPSAAVPKSLVSPPAKRERDAAAGGADLVATVRRALTATGHACAVIDPSTVVCDRDDAAKPTLVVLQVTQGKAMRLSFATSFPWKAATGPCDESAAKLNRLNRGSDLLKVFCTDELVTWVAPMVVPRRGVADEDVADFAAWFTATVQATLHQSELVPLLR
jgi:hypothetical protein